MTLPSIVAGPAKPGQVRKEAALRPRSSGACGGSVMHREPVAASACQFQRVLLLRDFHLKIFTCCTPVALVVALQTDGVTKPAGSFLLATTTPAPDIVKDRWRRNQRKWERGAIWLETLKSIGYFSDLPTRSSVAQLVEQAAVNRWVAGSSPAGGARFCSAYSQYRPVHRKRREVRLPAFFRFRLSRNDLRLIESPAATLRFERDQSGAERNPRGPFRAPESRVKTL